MSNRDDEPTQGRGRLFDRLKRSLASLDADAVGDVTLRRTTIEMFDQSDRERALAELDALLEKRIADANAGLSEPAEALFARLKAKYRALAQVPLEERAAWLRRYREEHDAEAKCERSTGAE